MFRVAYIKAQKEMEVYFFSLNSINAALFASLFTWAVGSMGTFSLFVNKNPSNKFLDFMLGFSSGVMITTSFFSLLSRGLEVAETPFMPIFGFIMGAIFIRFLDVILPHLHIGHPLQDKEGIETHWHKAILFFSAVTLHNVPEGLALGTSFSDVSQHGINSSAFALTVGIAIQNIPEGLVVSFSLRREGVGLMRSSLLGILSGFPEPVFSLLGAFVSSSYHGLISLFMGFAAGAMVFVVIEEAIPEAHRSGNVDLATGGAITGITLMLLLESLL